jgi:hypothetical protein
MRHEGESRRAGGAPAGRPRPRGIEALRHDDAIAQGEVFADLTLAFACCLAVALLGSLAASLF